MGEINITMGVGDPKAYTSPAQVYIEIRCLGTYLPTILFRNVRFSYTGAFMRTVTMLTSLALLFASFAQWRMFA